MGTAHSRRSLGTFPSSWRGYVASSIVARSANRPHALKAAFQLSDSAAVEARSGHASGRHIVDLLYSQPTPRFVFIIKTIAYNQACTLLLKGRVHFISSGKQMINRSSWWWKSCGVAIALSFVIPNVAQANFLIGTIAGNDCSGIYGQPPNCTVPIYDGEGNPILDEEGNQTYSPLIAKFDLTGGVFVFTPGIYDSIDGTEFSFNFDGGPSGADGLNGTGSWTYNPGADDPPVLMFTAKGGPNFNLFVNTGGNTDNYYMPTNPNNGKPYGFSHIVFFDSGDGGPTQQIPESGVLFLIGAGVLGLALSRRRRA